jgi:hypothetical protein
LIFVFDTLVAQKAKQKHEYCFNLLLYLIKLLLLQHTCSATDGAAVPGPGEPIPVTILDSGNLATILQDLAPCFPADNTFCKLIDEYHAAYICEVSALVNPFAPLTCNSDGQVVQMYDNQQQI